MTVLTRLTATIMVVLVIGCSAPEAANDQALAVPIDDTSGEPLGEAVGRFVYATENQNYTTIVAFLPPSLLDAMAKPLGGDTQKLKYAISSALAAQAETVTIEAMKIDAEDAQVETLSDGRRYALLPTTMTVVANGQRVRTSGSTLALTDRGQWRMLSTDESPMTEKIIEVFPSLSSVEFPQTSMEVIGTVDGP